MKIGKPALNKSNANSRSFNVCASGFRASLVCLLAFCCLSSGARSAAQTPQKVVQGRVVAAANQPQPGAVVYLKNDRTNDIKSFISIADGSYRFGQLSPDIDYEVWAEYQGKKSPVKTVSSFDLKKTLSYELKLDGK